MQTTWERTRGAWGTPQRALRVQVLGASTVVGRELACALLELAHPVGNLSLVSLRPQACTWHGTDVMVHGMSQSPPPAEIVFLCSANARVVAAAAVQVQHGSRVVDVAGAFLGREDVPLSVPGTALPDAGVFTQLVALPHRSAVLVGPLLWSLDSAFGLAEVHLVHLASAAEEGTRAILELRGELSQPAAGGGRVGNVLVESGQGPDRELLLQRELLQLIGRPDVPIDVSAVRVDVERCDSFACHLRFDRPVRAEEVERLLAALPGVQVVGDRDLERLTPHACQGLDRVHVGRIRAGSRGPGSVCFFAVGDQLRVGAAGAALQVAAGFALS